MKEEPFAMNVTESPIDAETRGDIEETAEEAAVILGLDPAGHSSLQLVEAIDLFLNRWQGDDRPEVDQDDDFSLILGSLWGEQLRQALRWEWAGLTFHDHDDNTAVGIFSPDRSLAIYPFHFVYGCLEQQAMVTVLLSFKMLIDGSRIPELPARGYENVMDHIEH